MVSHYLQAQETIPSTSQVTTTISQAAAEMTISSYQEQETILMAEPEQTISLITAKEILNPIPMLTRIQAV